MTDLLILVCDAIIHSDTKEKVPLLFRLSAFVPLNVVICAGLVMPNPSVLAPLFLELFFLFLRVFNLFNDHIEHSVLSI